MLVPRLAPDFTGIGPLGFTLTKTNWLNRHATGALTYNTYRLEELHQGVSPEVEVGVQEHQPDRRDQEQPTDCREAGCNPEQEADPDGEFSDVLQSPEKSPAG